VMQHNTRLQFRGGRNHRELPEPIEITIEGKPVFKSSQVHGLSARQHRQFVREHGNGYVLVRDSFATDHPEALERLVRTGKRDSVDPTQQRTPAHHGKYIAQTSGRQEPGRVTGTGTGLVVVLENVSYAGETDAKETRKTKKCQGASTSKKSADKPETQAVIGSVTAF